MNLLLLAGLGAVAVGFVLRPVLGRQAAAGEEEPKASRQWQALSEEKERLLAAIKDLEFEYEAGKLSKDDYERIRREDLAQVARIMKRLDELSTKRPSKPKARAPRAESAPATETPAPSPTPETDARPTCSACGQTSPAGARFCMSCGKPLSIPLQCPACGTELPDEARFCTDCGASVKA